MGNGYLTIQEQTKKEHIAFFRNGLKEGKWRYFYKSGVNLRIANFKNDKRNGKWSVFFDTGKLDHEGKFKEDKEDGMWTSWYEENERINEKGLFKMGVMDGKWNGFYDNGNQKFTANYSNGIKHGEYIKFYPNGRTGIKETYNHGLLEGKYEAYYDKGFFLREKGQYKLVKPTVDNVRNTLDTIIIKNNGDTIRVEKDPLIKFRERQNKSLKDGLWIVYFDGTNTPYQKINYVNGRLSGSFITYYSNGNKQSKITYKNGRKNGISKFYDKNGKLVKRLKYILDNKIEK
jgi:antitoxin component YwqK of YwqJK toxin-antitoxin module